MRYLLSLCLLSFSLPLLAQTTVSPGAAPDPVTPGTFPVEVDLQAEGLDIDVATSSVGRVVGVTLTNQGQEAARCTVTFHNGPEIAGPVRVELGAGAEAQATETLDREAIVVRTDVECERT